MNFFETQAGYHFFQYKVPRITKALEDIAEALSKIQPVNNTDTTQDKTLLHRLFYGSYDPELYQSNEQIILLNRQVSQAEKALRETLSSVSDDLLDAYQRADQIRDDEVSAQAYAAGFRTAVQMILSGCMTPHSGTTDIPTDKI